MLLGTKDGLLYVSYTQMRRDVALEGGCEEAEKKAESVLGPGQRGETGAQGSGKEALRQSPGELIGLEWQEDRNWGGSGGAQVKERPARPIARAVR